MTYITKDFWRTAVLAKRDPGPKDGPPRYIGELWVNQKADTLWILVKFERGDAIWQLISLGAFVTDEDGKLEKSEEPMFVVEKKKKAGKLT